MRAAKKIAGSYGFASLATIATEGVERQRRQEPSRGEPFGEPESALDAELSGAARPRARGSPNLSHARSRAGTILATTRPRLGVAAKRPECALD